MRQDQFVEAANLAEFDPGKPTADEINLVSTILPDLLLLVQQLEQTDEG